MKLKYIQYIHKHSDRERHNCKSYVATFKNPLYHHKPRKVIKALRKSYSDMIIKLHGRVPNLRRDVPLKKAHRVDVYIYPKN